MHSDSFFKQLFGLIARLDRAIQQSRDVGAQIDTPSRILDAT
jgi:hypothetical protein